MAQLTLVLNFLKHDLVIQLGAGISPEDNDDDDKEVLVVESSGDHTVRQVGFTRVEEEEDEDDKVTYNGRLRG
jgi:hypothetical protein